MCIVTAVVWFMGRIQDEGEMTIAEFFLKGFLTGGFGKCMFVMHVILR